MWFRCFRSFLLVAYRNFSGNSPFSTHIKKYFFHELKNDNLNIVSSKISKTIIKMK